MTPTAEMTQVTFLPVASIRPSPENDKLYRPVTAADPEVIALAKSIQKHGIKQPLTVTLDGYIVSGHRRYAAAKLAGLESVPCIVENIRRENDPDAFTIALVEHNRQRVKSFDEQVRETVVGMTPGKAYSKLIAERKSRARVKAPVIELRNGKARSKISRASVPFLNAVIKIVNDLKNYWPISERKIHYDLLNDPPLTHASKPDSRYRTDDEKKTWTHKLSRLVTRARLEGYIPEDIKKTKVVRKHTIKKMI